MRLHHQEIEGRHNCHGESSECTRSELLTANCLNKNYRGNHRAGTERFNKATHHPIKLLTAAAGHAGMGDPRGYFYTFSYLCLDCGAAVIKEDYESGL